jgi:hypothetical protein
MPEIGKRELAEQVVINWAAGLAGYYGPEASALAVGTVPLALAGLDRIASIIGSRRQEHAAEALLDGAEAFGADTPEEFVAFIEAAVSDEEHQELLARALTIAQDTAMRDKRRALGRALAAAASDTGTKVDTELLFIRALDDLDAPHIRMLRLLSTAPPELDDAGRQMVVIGQGAVRHWDMRSIAGSDPGLTDTAPTLFRNLELHGLVWIGGEEATNVSPSAEYVITPYGSFFLTRLAEPERPA